MCEVFYYRKVDKKTIWTEGKSDLSSAAKYQDDYFRYLTKGEGFPSVWRPSTSDEIEKIALGILLKKDSWDKIELIAIKSLCFEKPQINTQQKIALDFPIPSVSHLHYELVNYNNAQIKQSIDFFLQCNGKFKTFVKIDGEDSMINIVKKYLPEIKGQNSKGQNYTANGLEVNFF